MALGNKMRIYGPNQEIFEALRGSNIQLILDVTNDPNFFFLPRLKKEKKVPLPKDFRNSNKQILPCILDAIVTP